MKILVGILTPLQLFTIIIRWVDDAKVEQKADFQMVPY